MPSARFSPLLHPFRQHAWLRRAAWALAALAALWLFGWLALPALVKGPLERAASERLGRTVTVGAVEFKPWSLEATLRDIAVASAAGGPPQLTVARVYADAELQSIVRLAPVVDALEVDQPHLRVALLSDGHYDFDDILERLAQRPAEPDAAPARLALYNLKLSGGAIDVDDRRVDETHTVRGLELRLPFLSTLPSQRDVKVAPHLSFALNGSQFDSTAEATPFAQTGQGQARVQWQGVDLAPYLAYLPASLPVSVQGATLDVDLALDFAQQPRPAVTLRGTVQARGVAVADRQKQALLSFERLTLALDDVRPLEQAVHLSSAELVAPVLDVRRAASGALNLAALAQPTAGAAAPARAKAPAPGAQPAAPAKPWAVSIGQIGVRGGLLRWEDASLRPAAEIALEKLELSAEGLRLPFEAPVRFTGSAELQGSAVALQGQASDRTAEADITLQSLGLAWAAPYLAQALEPRLSGEITGTVGVQWAAPAEANASGLTVRAGPLALDRWALGQGKRPLARLQQLSVDGLVLDLDGRSVDIERLALAQPETQVERGADGRWMFERWLKTPPSAADAAPTPERPWRVRLGELNVERGAVSLADQAAGRPVALQLSALKLQARKLASDGQRPEALSLSAQVSSGRGKPGSIDYRGSFTPAPLAAQGQLALARVPLHALEGYLARQVAVELLHGELGFQGQLAFAQATRGTTLRLQGNATLDQLRANSTAAATPKTEAQVGEELLTWKSLRLQGLAVALAPDTAPRIEVQETHLGDFFARVTVNENGRINLADLSHPGAGGEGATSAAPVAAAPSATTSASAPAAPAASAAPAAPDPLAPVVRFGPVHLSEGRVQFSDFFIQPNYSASLSELSGTLSAFSSQAPGGGEPQLADLSLRGRAQGTAALEITGKLNPLAKPLALDIQGRVRDLELPPLSPYSVKFAGHGIERGKLSMDVAYKVLPNGELTATNKLVLHQLSFGEPVAGAPNSLPVRLAVALLADRNGVIDLDLPLSGSLNDPQFRIGPLIFKIIGNLVAKALTAPFSLLANAMGGGNEMSQVAFAPGSAELTAPAREALDKVAKALADRPALRLTVTGTASLAQERGALLRAQLQERLLAEKRRRTPDDRAPVQSAERPELVASLYGRTDMPKPRNLVGLAKELPVADMEALLLAQLPAPTPAQAAALAAQRGEAVKAYLAQQQLPEARLFLAAPKMADGASTGPADAPWTPQAQLGLSAQ